MIVKISDSHKPNVYPNFLSVMNQVYTTFSFRETRILSYPLVHQYLLNINGINYALCSQIQLIFESYQLSESIQICPTVPRNYKKCGDAIIEGYSKFQTSNKVQVKPCSYVRVKTTIPVFIEIILFFLLESTLIYTSSSIQCIWAILVGCLLHGLQTQL